MSGTSREALAESSRPAARWGYGLHGNVPGHQLDWIQRQGLEAVGLRPHQLAQLLTLIRDYDVPSPSRATLTIGNLSRDVMKQGPGRDELALLWHFRVASRRDHGGRVNPRLVLTGVHPGAALSVEGLADAATYGLSVTRAGAASGHRAVDEWYGRYVDAVRSGSAVAPLFAELFARLLREAGSRSQPRDEGWARADALEVPPRLLVLCEDELAPEATRFMAQVAHMLSRSTLRWHSVTTCRAVNHLEEGLVVQVLPEHERRPQRLPVVRLADLGANSAVAAQALLGLVPQVPERFVPISVLSRAQSASSDDTPSPQDSASESVPAPRRPFLGPSPEELLADARFAALIEDTEPSQSPRPVAFASPRWPWAVSVVLLLLLVLLVGLLASRAGPEPIEPGPLPAELLPSGRVEVTQVSGLLEPPEEGDDPSGGASAVEVTSQANEPPANDARAEPAAQPQGGGSTGAPSPRTRPAHDTAPTRPAARAPAPPDDAPPPAYVDVASTGERIELRGPSGTRILTGPSEVPPGRYTVWVRFAEGEEWVSYGELELSAGGRASIRCAMWSCGVKR